MSWNTINYGTRTCPCRGCTDRSIYCHGTCEKYKDFLQVVADIRDARKEQKDRDWDTYNGNIEMFKRKRRLIK